MTRLALIVPTLNAGQRWLDWLMALERQTLKPDYLLLIDSGSTDDTVELAREQGFSVRHIDRADFNHGGTRQWAVSLLPAVDVVAFLTQDAILATNDAIEQLVSAFADASVAAAYGRQLPHRDAGPLGAHARLFNYPASSQLRSLADRARFGLKTVFISNSFAAYRRSTLIQVGGFPGDVIMNEDTHVAGKLLMAGWKVAYRAEAQVYHSHDYGFIDEFRRYFDIGVFHAQTPWLRDTFGGASGEGWRFVRSELTYLSRQAPWLIPSAWLRTSLKGLGFKMGGMAASRLPLAFNRALSLHRAYWRVEAE